MTPGEVLPAGELLGDLLMETNNPKQALIAYESDLKQHPNRFNDLYGAALASKKLGNIEKAISYYEQLIGQAPNSNRRELMDAADFLNL